MAWITPCTICEIEKIILDREQVICHECSEAVAKKNLTKLALSMRCRCKVCKTFLTEADGHFAVCKKCVKKIKSNYKKIMRQKAEDKKNGVRRYA